jgi:hypothetical protein
MIVATPEKTTQSTQTPESTEDKKAPKAADIEKLKGDLRFDLPAAKIRTSEDAYQAFLREEITEEELRAVVAANGGTAYYGMKSDLERPDNAFKRTVPEDLYTDPSVAVSSVEDRLKAVEERDKAAAEATEKAEAEAEKNK